MLKTWCNKAFIQSSTVSADSSSTHHHRIATKDTTIPSWNRFSMPNPSYYPEYLWIISNQIPLMNFRIKKWYICFIFSSKRRSLWNESFHILLEDKPHAKPIELEVTSRKKQKVVIINSYEEIKSECINMICNNWKMPLSSATREMF